MIDQDVFKVTWALLLDRFNKQASTPLMVAYYESLSPKLTTEQFRTGAQRIFEENEFFPKPADFVEFGIGDVQTEALRQWEIVLQLMRGYEVVGLTDESRRVINMLGGEGEMRRSNIDSVTFIRKDFVQLYGDAATIARREAGERLLETSRTPQLTNGAHGMQRVQITPPRQA